VLPHCMLSLDIVTGDLHLSVTSYEIPSASNIHLILSQDDSTTRWSLYLPSFPILSSFPLQQPPSTTVKDDNTTSPTTIMDDNAAPFTTIMNKDTTSPTTTTVMNNDATSSTTIVDDDEPWTAEEEAALIGSVVYVLMLREDRTKIEDALYKIFRNFPVTDDGYEKLSTRLREAGTVFRDADEIK
jgi:hypothetical protein